MSHSTITLRRSKRSMMTPPRVPRRKPGSTRVVMTRLTAAPELSDTRAAMARIAKRPTQSPRLETTCAIQSRKKVLLPKSRHGASGSAAPTHGRDERRLAVDGCSSVIRADDPGAGPGAGGVVAFLVARLAGAFFAVVFFAVAFLAVDFFAVAFLAVVFFAVAFFVVGPRAGAFGEQLDRFLERDRVRIDAARHGGVGGAVGDVRTEAAVEHAHRLSGLGIAPSSAIGGFAFRPRRCLGWAKIACASAA